jgi:hypothetical protein
VELYEPDVLCLPDVEFLYEPDVLFLPDVEFLYEPDVLVSLTWSFFMSLTCSSP